jgi:hypothetical protein
MKTYNPDEVQVTIDGVNIQGFAEVKMKTGTPLPLKEQKAITKKIIESDVPIEEKAKALEDYVSSKIYDSMINFRKIPR